MLDVLIRDGMVVDGTGSPWTRADVGIAGGRVVAVGHLEGASAGRTVDAAGLVVAPGFIDCHSHSDGGVLQNRGCESTLLQGVTTEVVGNCGSLAGAPAAGRRTGGSTTFGQRFLDEVGPAGGLGANYAFLVGHGAIRRAVMGSAGAPAHGRGAGGHGAPPGAVAGRRGPTASPPGWSSSRAGRPRLDELIGLNRVLARYDRVHATHQRNRNEGFEASVAEAIAHCEPAGVRLQIAHNNARYGSPPGAWERVMEQIEGARRRGLDVSCDTTTYTRGGRGHVRRAAPLAA